VVGMKGGQTPGAQRTGVYNSYVPLAGAHNAAAGFGVWDNDIPVVGTIADCNGCIGAELLAIADLYCQQAALPDDILLPEPSPGPWAVLRAFSTAAEDTAMGLVFNAQGSEANELGRVIQVDLLRENTVYPYLDVDVALRHTGTICLAPGASHSVPATDGSQPAPGFELTVWNLGSAAPACVEVQETAYRAHVELGDGLQDPDTATFLLRRALGSLDESWSLEFIGLDPQPGNLLAVSAHDPGTTTSVDAGGGVPGAPKPVASRLLPNVPNPFNPSTTIRFDLAAGSAVDLRVFDVRGRLVRTLAAGIPYGQGRHTLLWDGRDDSGGPVASGVYVVELATDGTRDSQRVLMLK